MLLTISGAFPVVQRVLITPTRILIKIMILYGASHVSYNLPIIILLIM